MIYFSAYITHAGVLEALVYGILCPPLLARMDLMFFGVELDLKTSFPECLANKAIKGCSGFFSHFS